MNQQVETVYLNHDNSIDLILKADGVAVDLAAVTRMTLSIGSTLVDSDNGASDPIRWSKSGYATGEARLFLGSLSIASGRYSARLVVYDPSNPNGIVWGDLVIVAQ